MGRPARIRTAAAIGAIATVLAGPAGTSADERRLTLTLRPGSPASPVTMELTSPASRPAVPSLTLSGGKSIQLTRWSLPLPHFAVQGVSFAPRYGEHQLSMAFQPSALPGLAVAPRTVRGVAVATTGRRFSGALLAGRIGGGGSLNPLEPAVPQLLAFSGTLTPRANVAVSPRLVVPLASRGTNSVDPTMGLGMRGDLGRRLTVIGDVGTTRSRTHGWALTATAAVAGRWERMSFEGGASHSDRGVTLLGPVPFAASSRQFSSVRVQLLNGLTAEGTLSSVSRLVAQHDRTVARSVALRLERFAHGSVRLQFDQSRTRIHHPQGITIEWRERTRGMIAIQFQEQRDRSRPGAAVTRRVQFEAPTIRGAHELTMAVRSSILLSNAHPGETRATTHVAGRIAAARVGVSGEVELHALGSGSVVRLRRLATGVDLPLSGRTSVQIGYRLTAGDRVTGWRRLEIRTTRTF